MSEDNTIYLDRDGRGSGRRPLRDSRTPYHGLMKRTTHSPFEWEIYVEEGR